MISWRIGVEVKPGVGSFLYNSMSTKTLQRSDVLCASSFDAASDDDGSAAAQWAASMRKSFERDLESFQRMLPQLLQRGHQAFVALSNGEIVDQDNDEIILAQRVARSFKDRFVLIQEVRAAAPIQYCVKQ